MKCTEIHKKISIYLDGEIHSGDSRRITQHLSKCAQCRRELTEFQTIDDLITHLPPVAVSERFTWKVLLNVRRMPAPGSKLPLTGRIMNGLFAFCKNFLDLLTLNRNPSTRSLDEFSDFPPCSLSHVYFKIL